MIIYIYERDNYEKAKKENIFYQIPAKSKMRVKGKKDYSSNNFYKRVPQRNCGFTVAAFSF
jgi:hypothetical protein